MDFDKWRVTVIYHCGIFQDRFTALKPLWAPPFLPSSCPSWFSFALNTDVVNTHHITQVTSQSYRCHDCEVFELLWVAKLSANPGLVQAHLNFRKWAVLSLPYLTCLIFSICLPLLWYSVFWFLLTNLSVGWFYFLAKVCELVGYLFLLMEHSTEG